MCSSCDINFVLVSKERDHETEIPLQNCRDGQEARFSTGGSNCAKAEGHG